MSDLGLEAVRAAEEGHTGRHSTRLQQGSDRRKSLDLKCFPTGYVGCANIANMEIGDRIRHARSAAGMSQRELATAIGVSHGIVGQWEARIKKPGRESLRKIAQVLLLDPGALMRDVGEPGKDGLLVTDKRQIDMLRRFVLLSPRQQEHVLEFFGIARDVRLEIEKRREPSHRRLAEADAT